MSKIREEANCVLRSEDPEYECHTTLVEYAKRVLLLEKAYRYQRAANKMRLWVLKQLIVNTDWSAGIVELMMLHVDVNCKANEIMHKAAELYKQAEEL